MLHEIPFFSSFLLLILHYIIHHNQNKFIYGLRDGACVDLIVGEPDLRGGDGTVVICWRDGTGVGLTGAREVGCLVLLG